MGSSICIYSTPTPSLFVSVMDLAVYHATRYSMQSTPLNGACVYIYITWLNVVCITLLWLTAEWLTPASPATARHPAAELQDGGHANEGGSRCQHPGTRQRVLHGGCAHARAQAWHTCSM